MTYRRSMLLIAFATGVCCGPSALAETPNAQRGRQALVSRSFNPPGWSTQAYEDAWRRWPGVTGKPRDYAQAFMERYGLHPAPFPNGNYPMGLRSAQLLFRAGISTDCLICHGGSIAGQSYIGLGNTALDLQALFEDLAAADGRSASTPFPFCNVRGTNEAGAMAVFLFSFRQPDLSLRDRPIDLGLHADMCEDVPAWWLLKKKRTMYYTGSADARSVRSLMQFMLSPLNSISRLQKEESTFADIQAFILSLEPPKYPLPINEPLAHRGEAVFLDHCARCHGTYGTNPTYPNRIIPIEVIGTDRTRLDGLTQSAGRFYNATWFAHERTGWLADDYAAMGTGGYQAPPLDGVWATAPYFHNGSVPTLYHVLNSRERPTVYTRSYATTLDAYDPVKVGWKVDLVNPSATTSPTPYEHRKVYNTHLPGRSNRGHTFGDILSEDERLAVIEYLKTF